MDLITKIRTFFFYNYIGKDQFGNKYYEQKPRKEVGALKRIVKYNGLPEASKVPPGWHGWLHHNNNNIPNNQTNQEYHWQRQHLPNLSGTVHLKLPTKYIDNSKNDTNNETQYNAWAPKSNISEKNE